MRCCTDRPLTGRAPRTGGQALVEAAIVIPLGLLLLLAVGYLGRGLIERQTVLMAARYAARQAALEAMRSPADKFSGLGVVRESTTSGDRGQAAHDAARTQVAVDPPVWGGVISVYTDRLRPLPLGPYGVAFEAQSSKQLVDGKSVQFALGFVLYGAKVSEKLSILEPIRKQLVGVAQNYGHPGPALLSPLTVSGSAFMPGEAPVHDPGLPSVGLVENNQWIEDILKSPS